MPRSSTRTPSQHACDRETVHWLNQRYRHEFDRAESLQAELNNLRQSRAFRLLSLWRRWTGFFRSVPRAKTLGPFPWRPLESTVPAGRVSLVIPFKDRLDLLKNCLRSLRKSTWPIEEIILIDNGSTSRRMQRFLLRMEQRPGFQVVRSPGPFNFSRLCNLGACQARGDFLVFLNNDTEVLATDWLEHLLGLGCWQDVGVVGATLLYPDATLQHVGVFPVEGGQWTHPYRGRPQNDAGELGELLQPRTVPAVTGACLFIGRNLFTAMGGFDERLPTTLNDVDLCCRVRQRGLKVAISPHARLWHFESVSRGYTVDQ